MPQFIACVFFEDFSLCKSLFDTRTRILYESDRFAS